MGVLAGVGQTIMHNQAKTFDDEHSAMWEHALPGLILDAMRGIAPTTFEGPGGVLHALKTAADEVNKRNAAILSRTVDFSMTASDTMAASAKSTVVVRKVNNRAHEMSAAIEELTSSIAQVSQSADSASSILARCAELARHGADSSDKTSQSMVHLSDSVEATSRRVDSLANSSTEIGKIVDTIEAIAGQTNLLALNATIEAAQAGEAGRGFAVVAAEVKQLSTQTAKATDDIRKRIESLQSEVDLILEAMQKSRSAVEDGRAACDEAADASRTTASEVAVGTESVNEIAHVLNEQRAATEELAIGVTSVAEYADAAESRMKLILDSASNTENVIQSQFAELEGFTIKDSVLYRAKSDHFFWKKNLSAMVAGMSVVKPEELSDHTFCRLGKWYSAQNDRSILNHPAYRDLEAPHAEVHAKGRLAAEQFKRGDHELAEESIADMEKASERVAMLLDALISR